MRKLTVLAMLSAGMGFGTQALADTTIGFTIYKYDDNFMSVVRQAIEKEAAADSNTRILMNDSQNSQSMQNDQVDVMLARGVQALAINLVDRRLHPPSSRKLKSTTFLWCFTTKNRPLKRWPVMTKRFMSELTLKSLASFKAI